MLVYNVWKPEDWRHPWPPKTAHIGVYIGERHEGRPLSEAAVRYRKKVILEALRTGSYATRKQGKAVNERKEIR